MTPAAQPVNRFLPCSSLLVIITSFWQIVANSRHLISGSFSFISFIHTWLPRGQPFPERSAPWLFTTEPSGGLIPPPARRHRWSYPTTGSHHLNYSMQNFSLPLSCFSAHYDKWRKIRFANEIALLCCVVLSCQTTRMIVCTTKLQLYFKTRHLLLLSLLWQVIY